MPSDPAYGTRRRNSTSTSQLDLDVAPADTLVMTSRTFTAQVLRPDDGPGHAIEVPFDPVEVFGRARAPVMVIINGHPAFRTTLASYGGRGMDRAAQGPTHRHGAARRRRRDGVRRSSTTPRATWTFHPN